MRLDLTWVATACLLMAPGTGSAGPKARPPQGSRKEAQAMVEKGVRWVKEHGRERTLAEITRAGTEKKGAFIDRDLYLFAYDFQGLNVAHGANPKLVGKNLYDLADADGKFLIQGLIETARKGSGWYRYKWSNPLTKKIEDKLAFVMKVDDTLWLGCGVYGSQADQ
jgi:methyl-accepting chemotaxis protein